MIAKGLPELFREGWRKGQRYAEVFPTNRKSHTDYKSITEKKTHTLTSKTTHHTKLLTPKLNNKNYKKNTNSVLKISP